MRWILLACVPFLAGCEALQTAAADPNVGALVDAAVKDATANLSSGEWEWNTEKYATLGGTALLSMLGVNQWRNKAREKRGEPTGSRPAAG